MSRIIQGDCLGVLKTLPDESVHCCVTSPPYWGLRDYGVDAQFGLEKTPEEYVAKMVEIFREVKRVLKKEGTCWINLGDSYVGSGKGRNTDGSMGKLKSKLQQGNLGSYQGNAPSTKDIEGLKSKDIVGIPWRVAFALQADGWYLRQDIIWHKPNPMPESVTDRCTKSHEYIFLLAKSQKYYFDNEAIKENSVDDESYTGRRKRNEGKRGLPENREYGLQGFQLLNGEKYEKRNKRSVWTINTKSFKSAHFATFPEALIVPMILAGSKKGDTILDPFFGAGTTGLVAGKLGRNYIGCELNPKYIKIAERRIASETAQGRLL